MNSSATKTTVNIFNIPLGEIAKEEFYPYLAYINPKGDADGLMFENFVFDLSSGDTLADWECNLSRLFARDGGVTALDSAAAEVKTILGLSADKTFGVYIKAPLPKISLTPFGDINRDGITEKLLDVEDCLKAFSVFVSDFNRNMVISNPKNLEIKGWIFEKDNNNEILTACEGYLAEQGYKSYKNGVESLEITAETDFSRVIADSPEIRIISASTSEFNINCAFSQKNELRDVYDSLYILLNPEKFISKKACDGEIAHEIPLEPSENFADDFLEELFSDIPDTQEEIIIPKEPEVSEEPEESEVSEEAPCVESASDDKIVDEPKAITNEINLEISITQPEPEEKECPCTAKKCPKKDKLSQKQKRTLLGAGVAAAVLGLAYILGKAAKD